MPRRLVRGSCPVGVGFREFLDDRPIDGIDENEPPPQRGFFGAVAKDAPRRTATYAMPHLLGRCVAHGESDRARGENEGLFLVDRHPPSGSKTECTDATEENRGADPSTVDKSRIGRTEHSDRKATDRKREIQHTGDSTSAVVGKFVSATEGGDVEIVGK